MFISKKSLILLFYSCVRVQTIFDKPFRNTILEHNYNIHFDIERDLIIITRQNHFNLNSILK